MSSDPMVFVTKRFSSSICDAVTLLFASWKRHCTITLLDEVETQINDGSDATCNLAEEKDISLYVFICHLSLCIIIICFSRQNFYYSNIIFFDTKLREQNEHSTEINFFFLNLYYILCILKLFFKTFNWKRISLFNSTSSILTQIIRD